MQADSGGTIVQLFEWRWTDVAVECCAFLGPREFDAVQVSPPQETFSTSSLDEYCSAAQWCSSYQPVSFHIGNRLGDRSSFESMVSTCRRCGVRIFADAVINHMAEGNGTGSSSGAAFGNRTFADAGMTPQDFHHDEGDASRNCVISDFTNRANVQQCDIGFLPDVRLSPKSPSRGRAPVGRQFSCGHAARLTTTTHLSRPSQIASGASMPQRRLGAYLGDLASLGVAGFRVDAAKHIDALELGAILSANESARGKEAYQEVRGTPGEAVQPTEYVGNGRVTEFGLGERISTAVRAGDLASLRGVTDDLQLPSEAALVFIDNHDSQRSAAFLAQSTPRAAAKERSFRIGSDRIAKERVGSDRIAKERSFRAPLRAVEWAQSTRGLSRAASVRAAEVLTFKDGELYALASAFLLAWPYGRARVMSSYAFTDPKVGTAHTAIPSKSQQDPRAAAAG